MITRRDFLGGSAAGIVLGTGLLPACGGEDGSSAESNLNESSRIITNTHSIEGYGSKFSVSPGENLDFHIHAPRAPFSITIYRYGLKSEKIATFSNIEGGPQNYPSNAAKVGAGWTRTHTMRIGDDWRSGLYAADISDRSGSFRIPFVVHERQYGTAGNIAVVAANFTWEAYNTWPTRSKGEPHGASFYDYFMDDNEGIAFSTKVPDARVSEFVSLQRPNHLNGDPENGARAYGERFILSFLERNGFGYGMLSDSDLHRMVTVPKEYSTLILQAHPEYYSKEMYDALESFLARGGNLLYLGGNGVYWKVTVRDHQIEVRKEVDAAKRIHKHTGEPGGLWRYIGRPEQRILGVSYDDINLDAYRTYAPYAILEPEHWIFEGTGLKKGDPIGARGNLLFRPDGKGAAAGFEMDVMGPNSPKNLVALAKGKNVGTSGNAGMGADMVYYDNPGGGGVFSVGSMTFSGAIDSDPALGKILSNVLTRFTKA